MRTEISRGTGRLYRLGSEQLIDDVRYQLHEDRVEEPSRWWGEFMLVSVMNINESDRYIVEVEDGRRGGCYVRKLVNRVARGVPPRYLYHFTGTTPLE